MQEDAVAILRIQQESEAVLYDNSGGGYGEAPTTTSCPRMALPNA